MMIDEDQIKEILKRACPEVEPNLEEFNKPFSEIGLDSLDVFSFLSEIEAATGISLSEEEFAMVRTINDVIEIVNK